MRRRWGWTGAVGAAALAIGFVGWFPYYRLEREVAAAKSEGLWTELSDIPNGIRRAAPEGENAAPLVREAIAKGRSAGIYREDVGDAVTRILKRTATRSDRAQVQRIAEGKEGVLNAWQKASLRPKLDYGRDWKQGYAVLFPELADVRRAVQLLCAAAALGIQPKQNLLAAARLSVLTRQEPNLIVQIVSVSMGRSALKEAERQGLGSEIDKALGPPIDVRWTYMGELPCALDTMRRVGSPQWFKDLGAADSRDIFERIRNTGPWKANAAYRLVHEYRQMWREMPREGADYATAIRVIDRWMPKIDDELSNASSIMSKLMAPSSDASEAVKAFGKFEAQRKAVR